MNVKIGAEAAQFPEKEYINGIAVALCSRFLQTAWINTVQTEGSTERNLRIGKN
jgi:hypothetical protein